MKLLHTMIRVKNIEKSLEFYTKLFDLEVAKEMRLEDCSLYFISDVHGEVQIELTYNDETPKDGYEIGTGFGHFAFKVPSMSEFDKKLKEMYGETPNLTHAITEDARDFMANDQPEWFITELDKFLINLKVGK